MNLLDLLSADAFERPMLTLFACLGTFATFSGGMIGSMPELVGGAILIVVAFGVSLSRNE